MRRAEAWSTLSLRKFCNGEGEAGGRETSLEAVCGETGSYLLVKASLLASRLRALALELGVPVCL